MIKKLRYLLRVLFSDDLIKLKDRKECCMFWDHGMCPELDINIFILKNFLKKILKMKKKLCLYKAILFYFETCNKLNTV